MEPTTVTIEPTIAAPAPVAPSVATTPDEDAPQPITDLAARDFLTLGEKPARFIPRDPVSGIEVPGMWIDYLAADSQTGVAKRRELENQRAMRRAMKARKDKGVPPVLSMEEWEAEQIEHLAALATGWNVIWKGEALPFTTDNVRFLLTRLSWLRAQSAEFVGDNAEYLGN